LTSSIKKFDEITKVLHEPEDIIKSAIKLFNDVRERIDVCADHTSPSSHYMVKPIWHAIKQLKNKGIKTRFITEVTDKNLFYCRELIKVFDEVRHLDGIKGNFGIADGLEYRASPTSEENKPPSQYVISNVKTIVEQQQYFFDMLWAKASPASQRILEIEHGLERQFIKTIQDPIQIQKAIHELVMSASFEISIVFSESDEFYNQIKNGIIDQFYNLSKSKEVKIKILTPPMSDNIDNIKIQEKIAKIFKQHRDQNQHKIELRYLDKALQTKVTIWVVDRKLSLVIKSNRDKSEHLTIVTENIGDDANHHQPDGLAIYSNIESTVSSLASIFETLWRQIDLYEELSDLYKELKLRDEAQKEFIDIAAHELRSPIQPILGISEILHSKSGGSDNSEYLAVIVRNAKKLHRLAEDILDVTRIEKQSLKLNNEWFNLKETIKSVIQDSKNQISGFTGEIDIKIKPVDEGYDTVFVHGDRYRISQVIANLISNAIKFTDENRLITIIVEIRDTIAIISVRDNGAGISPEMIPRLFTKYTSKSHKGTGLGLYISKSIVEAHGGKIWAENNADGKGSVFSFSLPITDN
jgi:two-component system sensor histidine kinase VicK